MSPSDTSNTAGAAPAAGASPDEFQVFVDRVESDLAAFGEDVVIKVEGLVKQFDTKYWPYIKAFIVTLLSQEGKDALDAAIVAIPTGSPATIAAAVGAAVAGSLAANAAADAEAEVSAAKAADAANAAGTGSGSGAPAAGAGNGGSD